jgi:two-component system heavy metal sensor histidine kinase CusS
VTGSLRARLMGATAFVLAGALGLFWDALYFSFARALRREFDERLATDARALASLVEVPASGVWEMDPPSSGPSQVPYYELWTDDGRTLARSPHLGEHDLPRTGGPAAADTVLPDGSRGRRLQVELAPREEGPPAGPGHHLTVVVARSTDELERTLRLIRYRGGAAGLLAMIVGLSAIGLAVRRGLKPLERLAADIAAIDERSLGRRLPMAGVPRELRTTVARLNEALARLEESFTRERRVSADVSHELRTPLAALRSILEVAASRERDGAAYRAALDEALAVAAQLQRLVDDLLMLTRLEAGLAPVNREPVCLHDVVAECLRLHAPGARGRQLQCENTIPADLTVTSDRDKLRLVASNLIANAVQYTETGGTIAVRADPAAGIVLEVADSGPPIPAADLPRVFERFFRAEAARSGNGQNCGIGLSVVQAVCAVLSLRATAENTLDGGVRFRIHASPDAAGIDE